MKKWFSVALILVLLPLAACKKKEEPPAQTTEATKPAQQAPKDQTFKPKQKQRKKKDATKQVALADKLEIYSEKNLVKTIPASEFPTIPTTKIKTANNKEVEAILMKDFLAKQNVKGKNVAVYGDQRTTNLTWEQATSNDLYLILTPRKNLKVYATGKDFSTMKFPKRLDRITVSATVEASKPAETTKTTS